MEKRKENTFLKYIFQITKGWRGKLLYEYILILAVVACTVLVAYLLSAYIVKYTATEQSRQSTDVIFGQAEEQIKVFEEDVDNLYNNVVQNGYVAAYFQAGNFYDRWLNLEGFHQAVANNMRINRSLRGILLYNEDGELIGNRGDTFVGRFNRTLDNGQMTFSNCLTRDDIDEVYFEIGFPVYEEREKRRYYLIGEVYLLFDVNNLQSIVDGALVNEESAVAILDKEGTPLAKAGKWDSAFQAFTYTQEDDENLIYVTDVGGNGWRLISVVPKKSMISDITQMQQINTITYLMVVAAMVLVCTLIYKRVIQPISYQTAFMANFTKDTGKRIEVTGNNEIGELARKMNEMLDDIDELTKEVIDSQKKNLELEYAKKQTELFAYQSQMNPHFLFNTFNCIRGMALYKGEKEIAEMTMALTSFFRYSVQGDDMVTVREALYNLEHYAQIIQYRFNGKHRIEMRAAQDIANVKIPKMLIQPLVENAVLHGLERKTDNGLVEVDIVQIEKGLEIRVQDNGGGISREKMTELKQAMKCFDQDEAMKGQNYGIGLLNVYRRVRLYFGQEAEFVLESNEGSGTRISMLLPVGDK